MGEDERQLKNRFAELAARADRQGIWVSTDFLTMAEQDLLLSLRPALPVALYGGYDGAERRIACFGSEEQLGYPCEPDIACVSISPSSQKFAQELAHRDILGALMSLGIERRTTGDILIADNTGYLFCLGNIAGYIVDNLSSVKRTPVRCALSEPPRLVVQQPEPVSLTVASERLDALSAAVYRLSRTAAKELVLSGKVYVNSRLCLNPDSQLEEGCTISIRGYGRFRYEGALRHTKKGRLCVLVRLY